MYFQLNWRAATADDYSNTDDSPVTDIAWSMGQLHVGDVKQPLVCNLNPKRGKLLRDVYLVDIPLFSSRLVSALQSAGVTNLQCFAGGVRAPDGHLHLNYQAVNIVGAIACADLNRSLVIPGSVPPLMDFRKLVIREKHAAGQHFFRLYEDCSIIVSEKIKKLIDDGGFVGFSLLPVETSDD